MSKIRVVPADMNLAQFIERYVGALREHGTAVLDTEVQAYLQASPVAEKLTKGAEEAWQDLGELPTMPPEYSLARETFDVVGLTGKRRRARVVGWPMVGLTLIFLTLAGGLLAVNLLTESGSLPTTDRYEGQARVVDLRKLEKQEERAREINYLLTSGLAEERRRGVEQASLLTDSQLTPEIWARIARIAEGDPESDIQLRALGILAPGLGLESTASLNDMKVAVREALADAIGSGGLMISQSMREGEQAEERARRRAERVAAYREMRSEHRANDAKWGIRSDKELEEMTGIPAPEKKDD